MKWISLMALIVLCSCSIDPLEENEHGQQDIEECTHGSAEVTFRISNAFTTRSSISPNENGIQNINIYAYRAGILVDHHYSESPTIVAMSLAKGYTYNIYALANTGKILVPDNEEELSLLAYSIRSLSDLEECLPMAWSQTGIGVGNSATAVNIDLERLTSKLWFSLDSSLMEGVKVASAKLCQSASVVRPFAGEPSRAIDTSEVISGDYATESDIALLNEGSSICFYALENCQGELLKNNQDPWGKTPEAIGSKAGLCTYIEVVCEFEEGFIYTGTVTYRFYAGDDNTSDFSIRRNTEMEITLCLTGEGIREISWKIEPDVQVQPGYVDGWLDEGRHAINDLYVGEQIYYGVEVAPELLTHLGGDLSRCSLRMVSSDGGDMKLGNGSCKPGDTTAYYTGTCTSPGTGSLWIYDENGIKTAEVCSNVNIQTPRLVQSFFSSVSINDNDFAVDEQPWCEINGTDEQLHIYLTDKNGYNLNTDYWGGFDLSLFTFEDNPYMESDFDILNTISIKMTPGVANSDGPAATYTISCENDGRDPDINRELSYAIREWDAIVFDIDEHNYNISSVASVAADMQKVTLTMVDNGWADYADCQLSLKVDNPSNMPLIIKGWQINQTNHDWNAISRNECIDEVENEMTLDHIAYITSAYYSNEMPLFGQQFTIYSERNEDGDHYISEGDTMIYPIESISTDDMFMAMMYNKNGQEALHHLVDVTLPSGRLYSSEIALVDNLEDGSMRYNIIYGNDPENPGWNNKGMWLYSNGTQITKPNTSLDKYYNVTAKNLTDLFQRYDKTGAFNLEFTYDAAAGHLYAKCPNGNMYNIKIDSEISGTVKGYVETFPNGTWGSGKDNSCTANIYGGVSGVSVGTSNVSIDGGAIKAGMNAIYNQTFFDSKNWIGSANNYQHRAHPTSLTVKIRLNLSSASTPGLYPYTILWKVTSLPFYHAQDGVTYTPSMSKEISTFSICRVMRD